MGNTYFEAKDIFISWNHLDLDLKNVVAQAVEKGLFDNVNYMINSTMWVWDSDQHCSGDIDSSCLNSIDLCSVFVVIITENSLKSEWVAKEIKRALDTRGNSFIVPIHLSGTIPSDINNPFRRAVNSSGIDRTDGIFDDDDAELLKTKIVAAFNESCYWDYMQNSFRDLLTIDNEINSNEATNASIKSIYIERTLKKYNDPNEEEINEEELIALTDPVLVIGEGGSGKSWLIQNMIRGIRDRRGDSSPLIFAVPLKDMKDYDGSLEEYLFGVFVDPSRTFGYTLENFKALLKIKNRTGSLYIFFDAIDEILRKDAVGQITDKLSAFFKRYSECIVNTFFTSRNADYDFVGNSVNVISERIKAFSLNKFNAGKRKSAVEKLFLQLHFDGDKDFFFAALDSISEEITSNPFLLTQLVIIYKNEGSVPDALSEIYEKSVTYYLKRGPGSIDYPKLREVLNCCAYDKFITEAVKNDKFDFDKTFVFQCKNYKMSEKEAQEALAYLCRRSIVINNNFTATLVFELLTSIRLFHLLVIEKTVTDAFGADTKTYSINYETAQTIAKSSSENNKWDNILKIFLSKIDNELDEKAISVLYECFVGDCDNFMLFFETASSILKKRRDFELTVLSGILLKRTLAKDFGYYDELFFYIPKFELYNHLARAVLSVTNKPLTAFYLLRDMCFIYANKDKITEVDDIDIYADKLAEEFAELKTDSYRYRLCELFYKDDIIAPKALAEKHQPLYPREFCIIHAANRAAASADRALKKEHDLEEAPIDSPVAFADSDGIYAGTDFESDSFIGLCFLPYDTERINSCVIFGSAKMLSGVILLPTEHTEIERMSFPKTNLLYYSVPYNMTKLCDYCFNFCRDITYMFIPSFTESISEKSFLTVERLWLYYEYSPRMTTITRFLPEQTELYKLTSDSIVTIEELAFKGCTDLTLTALPDGVTEIGWGAFCGCTNLALSSLPNELNMIQPVSFFRCTNLVLRSLPALLTEIEKYAFSGCISLTLTSLPDRVTEIGLSAFQGCTNLALASLPDGVTEIGWNAFQNCSSLALASLPDGVTEIGWNAFQNCSSLALTSLPNGLTKIGESAFEGCTSLALTSLPDGLTEIGECAFEGCTSLALTFLPDRLIKIGKDAFKGCTNLTLTSLPEGLFFIDETAFEGCSKRILALVHKHNEHLKRNNATVIKHRECTVKKYEYLNNSYITEIIFPEGLSEIQESAFEGCTSLALTSLPDTLIKIKSNAFKGCTSLALTSLPERLSYIDESAFTGCSEKITMLVHKHIERLKINSAAIITHSRCTVKKYEYQNRTYITDICFPDGLTVIGRAAFYGCISLALASLPEGVTEIGGGAFKGCTNLSLASLPEGVTKINPLTFCDCTSLALTSLPDGVTEIGRWAFSGCTNLALASLPDGVTEIGWNAFQNCSSLALTSLPDGVTKIGWNAFQNCSSLALTSLPDGVSEIGWSAFQGCTSLALTSLPDGIINIETETFKGCKKLALNSLPDGLIAIERDAFKGCENLTLTELPPKLVVIEKSAFEGCIGITEMNMPEGVQEIGDRAFFGCSLRRVRIRSEFKPDVQRIFGDVPIVFEFY